MIAESGWDNGLYVSITCSHVRKSFLFLTEMSYYLPRIRENCVCSYYTNGRNGVNGIWSSGLTSELKCGLLIGLLLTLQNSL